MNSQANDNTDMAPDITHLDIWKFTLNGNPRDPRAHLKDLAQDERQRIDQGIFPELGERATRSRLGMRWILATYLNCSAVEVPLVIGPHGKPELSTDFKISPKSIFVIEKTEAPQRHVTAAQIFPIFWHP